MAAGSEPLWAVTSYFNPAGYRRRIRNFHAFRRLLGVPLLVVELARPGEHRLRPDDADIVLRPTGDDGIWQKERLLDLGTRALPPHVRHVAWIDADLVFEDPNWPAEAVRRLDARGGLLQLFDTARHLPPEIEPETATVEACARAVPVLDGTAVAHAIAAGAFDDNEVKLTAARTATGIAAYNKAIDRHNCYGMAWAAPRAAIEACGHYDRNVVGGGDAVHVYGALGRLDDFWRLRSVTEAQKRDIVAWAASARAAGLFAALDCLPGRAYHLWHGTLRNRNYRGRYDILTRHDFDPGRDLITTAEGVLGWRDPSGALARDVRDYFFSRHEDDE